MKIALKIMVLLSTLHFSSAQALDVVSKYSKNIVIVELNQNKDWIKFSYCDDKNQISSCIVLGKGWYEIEALKTYKIWQYGKLVGNGVGAVAAEGIGFYATLIGGIAAPGVGAIPGLIIMGGGYYLGKSFFSNIGNLITLSDSTLKDETIDVSVEVEYNDKQNFEEIRLAKIKRENDNYSQIKRRAMWIDSLLKSL